MENVRLQSGLSANENEYRCDGTSHWQPGYVLSCHVPPTSSRRSSTAKSSIPSSLSFTAMPMPAKPEPTTATFTCSVSIGTVPYHDGRRRKHAPRAPRLGHGRGRGTARLRGDDDHRRRRERARLAA